MHCTKGTTEQFPPLAPEMLLHLGDGPSGRAARGKGLVRFPSGERDEPTHPCFQPLEHITVASGP